MQNKRCASSFVLLSKIYKIRTHCCSIQNYQAVRYVRVYDNFPLNFSIIFSFKVTYYYMPGPSHILDYSTTNRFTYKFIFIFKYNNDHSPFYNSFLTLSDATGTPTAYVFFFANPTAYALSHAHVSDCVLMAELNIRQVKTPSS